MDQSGRKPLGDDAAVVRGGMTIPSVEDLKKQSLRAERKIGVHGISAAASGSPDYAAVLDEAVIPNGQVQVTTVAELARVGITVRLTRGHPHVTLELPKDLADTDHDALSACFGEPIKNPYPKKKR